MKLILNLLFFCAFTASFLTTTGFAQTATLTIRVPNLSNNTGKILFAVYKDNQNWLTRQPYREGIMAIKGKYVEITFTDLEAGKYALSCFHDENSNNELDLNFLGIPTEGFSFSNLSGMVYRKPKFKDCQFSLANGDKKTVVMTVIYFL